MIYKRGHNYPGLLISFDGRDGCGKSTQCNKFTDFLLLNIYKIVQAREPGGTELGEEIRKVLLNPRFKLSAYSELFLFQTSRTQLVTEIIIPALENRKIVCLDRFFDSTTAYQGSAGEVPLNFIFYTNRISSQEISPDRTYVLDVDSKTSAKRIGRELDRIESKNREYHERVRKAFIGLSKLEPDRIKLIDGMRDPDKIHKEIIKDFNDLVNQFGYQ